MDVDRRMAFALEDIEQTIRFDIEGDDTTLATLPLLPLKSVGDEPGLFEIKERLGLGGMGEVRLARQPALQRDVAIKLARSGASAAQPSQVLLREALVMGYLEHPNIVPIHIVGRDESGELVVAMKRIEGQTLQDRIARPDRLEVLDDNLEVLLGVCNAVEFAHQRGVVHLDIKPANIMVGSFGEVYLLDWGTAVAYRDDVPSTIPRPANDGMVRGTPAYFAAEMVAGEAVVPATDVFLLGGILYSLLTGYGPNTGNTTEAVCECAFREEPRELPDGCPPELAEIIHRALRPWPQQRFATAAQFRDAVAGYLRSRSARDMLEAGRRAAVRHADLIRANADSGRVYGAFGAARQFIVDARTAAKLDGYGEPELQSLLERMCEWELGRENAAGAEALIRELPSPNPELARRIAAAAAARSAEKAELAELRREVDPGVANKQKIAMWLLIGGAIALIYVTPALLGHRQAPTEALVGHVVYLGALLLVTALLSKRLLDTRLNREVVGLVWVLSIFGLFVRIGAFAGALSLSTAIALDLALVATMGGFATVTIDRRLVAALPFHLIGAGIALATTIDPALVFGVSHGVALTAIAGTYAIFGASRAST